ncbi:MAG: hypothetical protein KKD77_21165 [Gammaproteobacteria bacterium]|uniref:Uncharacterized protein n=1 Tax=viral metagenome TaxID=1070528 RepID=A0A6M3L090_9ZZZZ|nr:hypothetical protein [Gammaproteobacteria bacterium]
METIIEVLMRRDKMTREEAEDLWAQAKEDFDERLESGDDYFDIGDFCEEWFGLEPDYLEEFF